MRLNSVVQLREAGDGNTTGHSANSSDFLADDVLAEIFHTTVPSLSGAELELLRRLLSLEERNRAARFVFAKDRQLFIVAHALLNSRLMAATGRGQIQLRADRYGKPAFDPPCGSPPLSFNLSHTNGFAACVLSRGCRVGIDAEEIAARSGIDAVAEWALTPSEREIIAAGSNHSRLEIFYRLWTLKEAVVKAMGRGLGVPMQDIAVSLDALTLSFGAGIDEAAAQWRLCEFAPTAKHRMALAANVPTAASWALTSQQIQIDDLLRAGAALRH
jgi:4'-phosphopantetheinyl transferase